MHWGLSLWSAYCGGYDTSDRTDKYNYRFTVGDGEDADFGIWYNIHSVKLRLPVSALVDFPLNKETIRGEDSCFADGDTVTVLDGNNEEFV